MAQCLMKGEWSQLYLEIKGEKKMKENSRKKKNEVMRKKWMHRCLISEKS